MLCSKKIQFKFNCIVNLKKKIPNLLLCSFKRLALHVLQRKKKHYFNRNQYRQPGWDANAVYDCTLIHVVDKQLNKITKYIFVVF